MIPPLLAIDPSVVAVIGTIFAAAVAYFIAARQFSGKIGSTEASKLWDAATQMRREYIDQISTLTTEVKELRERVGGVEHSNTALSAENDRLAGQVHELNDLLEDANKKIGTLTDQIVALTGELRQSRDRVKELEDDVEDAEDAGT